MQNPVFKQLATATQQLIRDQCGNTMAVVAAAMIPLTAVIGGGFDVARARLAQSRLSQACDAAALAGRRAMSNEDIETAKPEALKFFNFNFPQGYMSSASFSPQITKPDTGTVEVQAQTTVPATIMKIFGHGTIPINVECQATQNFDNLDIVLVLDTTGSMAKNIAGTSTVGDSSSSSRMYALRQAVMALYDELKPAQDQLAAQGLRLRYGIVPYSSTVNVGKLLYSANPNYMISGNDTYQSRVPSFKTDKKGKVTFDQWTYQPVSYNINSLLSGGTLTTPTDNNGANLTFSWGGCIEERQTVSTITSSTPTTSVPTGANDLDLDLVPNSNATRWKPYITAGYTGTQNYYPGAEHGRNSSSNSTSGWEPQKACPREARRLAVMSRSDMQTYVDSLFSDGGTYHDIGMIWGGHFVSPTGIFAGDNPSVYNDRPVNRYVIFMTDGIMDTGTSIYTAYGLETLDKRVTGGWTSDSDQTSRHRQRFLIACNIAKQKGVSIWSIVFSPDTETTLQSCASSTDQYAQSTSSAALIAKFKEIGKNIGALRLSQ
jgi:Flp pilus assembly protein TadG